MPEYVGAEFSVLWVALEAYELALGSDVVRDRLVTESVVTSAAFELANCVQVATAQFKDLSAVDLLLANHLRVVEDNRILRTQLDEMAEGMLALASAQGEILRQLGQMAAETARGSGRRAGRGGRRRRERERSEEVGGGEGGGGGEDDGGLGGRVGGGSDSELSRPPSPSQQLEDEMDQT